MAGSEKMLWDSWLLRSVSGFGLGTHTPFMPLSHLMVFRTHPVAESMILTQCSFQAQFM